MTNKQYLHSQSYQILRDTISDAFPFSPNIAKHSTLIAHLQQHNWLISRGKFGSKLCLVTLLLPSLKFLYEISISLFLEKLKRIIMDTLPVQIPWRLCMLLAWMCKYREVFRTLSNIFDGGLICSIFCKRFYHRCFTAF